MEKFETCIQVALACGYRLGAACDDLAGFEAALAEAFARERVPR